MLQMEDLPCRWGRRELRLIRWVAWRSCRRPVSWWRSTSAMAPRDRMSSQHERWTCTTSSALNRLSTKQGEEKGKKPFENTTNQALGGEPLEIWRLMPAFLRRKQIFLIIHMQAFDWLPAILRLICEPMSAWGAHNKSLLFAFEKWDKFSWKSGEYISSWNNAAEGIVQS